MGHLPAPVWCSCGSLTMVCPDRSPHLNTRYSILYHNWNQLRLPACNDTQPLGGKSPPPAPEHLPPHPPDGPTDSLHPHKALAPGSAPLPPRPRTGVADHVWVCVVDAHHLVAPRAQRRNAGLCDLARLHVRLQVERDLVRGDLRRKVVGKVVRKVVGRWSGRRRCIEHLPGTGRARRECHLVQRYRPDNTAGRGGGGRVQCSLPWQALAAGTAPAEWRCRLVERKQACLWGVLSGRARAWNCGLRSAAQTGRSGGTAYARKCRLWPHGEARERAWPKAVGVCISR